MTPAAARTYHLGEFHAFESAGRRFVYLPAGAIFEIDDEASTVLARLQAGDTALESSELIEELRAARIIVAGEQAADPPQNAPFVFPLQTLVLNLTNQCNLSCQYCYEFGEDRVATPEGKPKFMDFETARASVDFLLEQSAGRRKIHITFFGGETLKIGRAHV